MKKIAYTRPDGGVSIVSPAPNAIREDEPEEQFIERIRLKDVPKDALNVRVIDEAECPADRTFRKAWKLGEGIEIDMPKAREVHRDRLRQIRAPLFQALDVAYQRADESGDAAEKLRIAESKQVLRDVTSDPIIAAASTPEELKEAIPQVLVTLLA